MGFVAAVFRVNHVIDTQLSWIAGQYILNLIIGTLVNLIHIQIKMLLIIVYCAYIRILSIFLTHLLITLRLIYLRLLLYTFLVLKVFISDDAVFVDVADVLYIIVDVLFNAMYRLHAFIEVDDAVNALFKVVRMLSLMYHVLTYFLVNYEYILVVNFILLRTVL